MKCTHKMFQVTNSGDACFSHQYVHIVDLLVMYLKIGTFLHPLVETNKNNEQKLHPRFCCMCFKMFISETNGATFVRLVYLNFKSV